MANYYTSYAGGNQGFTNAAYAPVQPAQATVTSYNVPTGFVQSNPHPAPQPAYAAYGSAVPTQNVTANSAYAYTSTPQSTVPVADTTQAYQQNNNFGRFSSSQPQQTGYKSAVTRPAAPQATQYYQTAPIQNQPLQSTNNYYTSNPAQNQQNNTVVQRTLSIPQTQNQQQSNFTNSSQSGAKKVDRPTMPNFSKPQQKDQISNYERALLSAATNYVNTNKKVGVGAGKNPSSTASYWKQKREMMKDPNKPIVASEIKGYLYAWLGKFRSRPDYNITAKGSSPFNQTFVCEMNAPGFSYAGKGKASNKKDSQTRAAWDFCDHLVKEGKMQVSELPFRENKFKVTPTNGDKTTPAQGEAIPTVTKGKTNVVAKPQMSFVGGSQLKVTPGGHYAEVKNVETSKPTASSSTTAPVVPKAPAKPLGKMDKNSPVGEEYVEQVWTDGRVVRYRCSICECEFTDSAARDLHVRGRRHKLSYKKKVDPSLEVDVKLNPKQKKLIEMKMRNEERREKMREQREKDQMWRKNMNRMQNLAMQEEEAFQRYEEQLMYYEMEMHRFRSMGMRPPMTLRPPRPPNLPHLAGNKLGQKHTATINDQHVLKKHSNIYPSDDELNAIQNTVNMVEKALKAVSDKIHEQELKVYTATAGHSKSAPVRLLKAVLRCGAVAKGLLLKDELLVDLVLLCNEKPTEMMLNRVVTNLPDHLADICDQKFLMRTVVEECAIYLTTSNDPKVTTKVVLTSTLMREVKEKEGATRPDPPNVLNRDRCCDALAELRHTKWFQAKASKIPTCVSLIRVMKDLCRRIPHWRPLTDWALELIVANTLSSYGSPMPPSVGFRRIFEVIASGILLPEGAGITDLCERDPTDVTANMTQQEKEEITSSAQHALRMVTYRQIHKILGIEEIGSEEEESRKRSNDEDETNGEEDAATSAKNIKLDEGVEEK